MARIISNGIETLVITPEDYPENPRDDIFERDRAYFGHLLTWTRGHSSPDENIYDSVSGFIEDMLVKHFSFKELSLAVNEFEKNVRKSNFRVVLNEEPYDIDNPTDTTKNYTLMFYDGKTREEICYWQGYTSPPDESEKLVVLAYFVANEMTSAPYFLKDKMALLPIYMLDHSGISYSTRSFNDVWDSGQVGFAYLTADELFEAYGNFSTPYNIDVAIDKAKSMLAEQVELYNDYVNGDVYQFSLYYENELIDACRGFYFNHSLNYKERIEDLVEHILSEAEVTTLTLEDACINEGEVWELESFDIDDFLVEHGFTKPVEEKLSSLEFISLGMLKELDQVAPSKADFAREQLKEAGFEKLITTDYENYKLAEKIVDVLDKDNVRFVDVEPGIDGR